MAEPTSAKKLTANELLVRKLKETFDRKGSPPNEGSNVWVMAAAAKPFQKGEDNGLTKIPDDGHRPTHRVRVVLRTSHAWEANPYVDGSDFFLEVDEQQQKAELVWEEDCFADAPSLHGSEVLTAIQWATELTNSLLYVCLSDPFLNETKRQQTGDATKQTGGDEEPWM
ncbi:hypothetical protein [Paenibacillus sp. YN15]|uniref:hypothetical protein n=1 Tax=Paenibacillus sp. YN15 TaxID=1742774 RepID=UPI000DCD7C5D|nr:hypothetical protein [Paenibacillus sp. YN15]RAV00170.1 hypothetical protein DQG13_14540 [Paenibacillus sp. YN15]